MEDIVLFYSQRASSPTHCFIRLPQETPFQRKFAVSELCVFYYFKPGDCSNLTAFISVHSYIESVYKKAVLNSDGTLGVRVHNRKINVDDIVGLEAVQSKPIRILAFHVFLVLIEK